MRDIEGIEKVVELLKPHWPDIDRHFHEENARFIGLATRPHDIIGRMLKSHLIVEYYLNRFLAEHYQIEDIESAKLGFFNKAALLPNSGSSAAFVKPGILQLNRLRNRAGHRLDTEIAFTDLGPINEVLAIARHGVQFREPIDAIEAFTTVACTWLAVPPKNLQELFVRAFAEVRVTSGKTPEHVIN